MLNSFQHLIQFIVMLNSFQHLILLSISSSLIFSSLSFRAESRNLIINSFYFISIHSLIVLFFFALPKKEPKKSRLIFISLNCYENFLSCARETVSLVPCSTAIAAKFSAIATELKRGRIFPYIRHAELDSASHPV